MAEGDHLIGEDADDGGRFDPSQYYPAPGDDADRARYGALGPLANVEAASALSFVAANGSRRARRQARILVGVVWGLPLLLFGVVVLVSLVRG